MKEGCVRKAANENKHKHSSNSSSNSSNDNTDSSGGRNKTTTAVCLRDKETKKKAAKTHPPHGPELMDSLRGVGPPHLHRNTDGVPVHLARPPAQVQPLVRRRPVDDLPAIKDGLCVAFHEHLRTLVAMLVEIGKQLRANRERGGRGGS